MRRITLLFAVFSALYVNGQVTLLKDINPSGSSFPGGYTEFNSQIFFAANDGSNGRELWVTDGTPSGTSVFKDINPGSGSGSPREFTVFNNALYFFADDGTIRNGLWKSDGTPEGTQFVAAAGDPASLNQPYGLVQFDNTLYFVANDASGYELWESDGTADGTQRLADIFEGSTSSNPAEFTVFDGKLFFVATAATARRVLHYVENGTVSAVDFTGTGDERYANNPENLTVFKDGLYFSADFRTGGFNWRYTQLGRIQAGTTFVSIITNINGGDDARVENLVAGDNYLLFTAEEESTGVEYWISDGTSSGTNLLMDIYPGSFGSLDSDPSVTAAGNLFFFNAEDPDHGEELWMTDGTAVGTRVLDLVPGDGSSFPRALTVYRGTLIFTAQNTAAGREIWTSFGNIDETLLVQDLKPGGSSSEVGGFRGIGDRVYFSGEADFITGKEPYYVDLADPCSLVECPEGETCFGGSCFSVCTSPELGEDIVSFSGEEVILDAGSGFTSYLWSTGETTRTIAVTTSGTYIVGAGTTCYTVEPDGLLYDTIHVFFQCVEDTCAAGQVCIDGFCYPDPCAGVECPEGDICINGGCFTDCTQSIAVELGADTIVLAGQTVMLDAGVDADGYLWSTGETTRTIAVGATDTYWVRTFGKCYEQADSINSDTIRVEVLCDDGNCPEGMSCIDGLCYGDPCALIECPAGHSCYEGGCFQDCSAFAFGPDTVLQQGQQLVLDAGDQAAPYFWSTGDTTYSITVTQPGIYWLNTFSPCYQAVDSIRVDYACDQGNCPEGQACVNGLCVTEDPCADIVCPSGESCYGGGCFQTCPDLELGPDITVPGGTGILLDAGDDWSDVYWSTGDFGNELMVNSSGRYIAAVLGNGVCYDADVQMDTINVMFTAYADGSCPPGQFNLNGYCYSSDQTSGCGEGYYRYDGECIPLNDCSLLTCPPGDTCYNGYCLPAFNAACDDCGPGEICYFGTCYPECVNSVEDLFMSLVSSGGAGLYGAYVPPELLRFVSALPGDTITIDPGPGFINIQWSNGDTGTIEITSSGTYSYVAEYEPENCTYIGVVFADFFCSGGDCPEGQICEDGICVDFDPCQYAFCPPGAACYNGFCLQLDIQTCFSNPCPPGEVCVNGFCAAESACSNVDCGPGETCVGGICYPNAEYDLCGDVDCGGIYSCLYGSCMQAETVSGPATISGVVAFAAGLKKGISFADDAVAGDAVEGARVYLLNPELDVVYKLDTTDASGSFSLNGIPEGTYKIVVESGLFTMDENNTIEISGDKVAYEILALIGEDEITIEEVTGMLPGKTFERFTIYPNPSTGDIYLSVGRAPGRLNVRLTDLAGRTVVSRQVEVRGSETRIIESGDDVLPGIYFLQIRKAGEMLGTERIVIY